MLTDENKNKIISAAQMMIANGMIEGAKSTLEKAGLNLEIRNGKIIDENDVTEDFLDKFITCNQQMVELKNDIRKLSKVNDEVLIIGPTGTGKEILANALHGAREGKFQSCNAAGLPEHLVESELFGHIRGAFTGAISDKIGLITKAKNGTFFLDEIGDLSLEAQTKLLRVLQEKELRPVGDTREIDVSCRFVFATNKDIKEMCDKGLFRDDLYARISTFEMHTLPLSVRKEDIDLIIKSLPDGDKFLVALKGGLDNDPFRKEFGEDFIWNLPFNVRSLQSLVKQWKVLGKLPV